MVLHLKLQHRPTGYLKLYLYGNGISDYKFLNTTLGFLTLVSLHIIAVIKSNTSDICHLKLFKVHDFYSFSLIYVIRIEHSDLKQDHKEGTLIN